MITTFAPNELPYKRVDQFSIFLAGSIENGSAYDWQTDITNKLSNIDCHIYNPRRLDWDWTWEQSIKNPKFVEQVEWELNALNKADFIFLHFEPNTKSPISLLELGLHAKCGKMWVHCPEGFWRKGNVDVVCNRYMLNVVDTIDEFVTYMYDHANRIQIINNDKDLISPFREDDHKFVEPEKIKKVWPPELGKYGMPISPYKM